MTAAWLCLLLASAPSFASSPADVEAPDQRSYAEATPEMLARREKTCRADLKDYVASPNLELMNRLIVCMEHSNPKVRAEVLDQLPDRRLWDRDDYETNVRPSLKEIMERFEHDPDEKVRLHAGQLSMWLGNGERWRDWESPAAQARRRAEEKMNRGHVQIDGDSAKLGNYALVAAVIAMVLIALFGRRFTAG